MLRSRLLKHIINLVLAVLIVLQMPLVQNTAVAASQPVPVAQPSNNLAPDPATASNMQVALDTLVNKAVSLTGLQLVSIQSQLDAATAQSSATHLAGTGRWQIELRDDRKQTLMLAGTLYYDATGEQEQKVLTGASVVITGTLTGNATELMLDTRSEGTLANDRGSQTGKTDLKFTRNGQTSRITASSASSAQPVAYNINRLIEHDSLDRDGTRSDLTRTITARIFGKGEREFWVQEVMTTGANNAPAYSSTQHYFQRTGPNSRSVTQYYDRYDLTFAGETFTLQAPGTVTGTLDGRVVSGLVLVDSQGKPVVKQQAQTHSKAGLAIPLRQGITPFDTGTMFYTPTDMPLAGACEDLTSNLGGFMMGVAISLAAAALLASGGIAAVSIGELIAGNLLTTAIGAIASEMEKNAKTPEERQRIEQVSLALQLALGLYGIAEFGGAAGVLGNFASYIAGKAASAICNPDNNHDGNKKNGDPFFINIDTRPSADPVNPTPIQITRVTGGLISSTAIISNNLATVSGGSMIAGGGQQYADKPEAFAGSTLPAQATEIGGWTWDVTRPFGASPSHTQARVDGPQKHYFIHAGRSLQLSDDDNIVQYVYLDPQHPPKEIYLQFYTGDGDGEYRAYWGDDLVQTGGKPGSPSLLPMGPLPKPGNWVRLKVPASSLGLSGKAINGVLYGTYDGQTWWGTTTTSSRQTDTALEAVVLEAALALPQTVPGAQIAYRLASPQKLTIAISGENNTPVRTLVKDQDRPAGYQVLVWDATGDSGTSVDDKPYTVHFSVGGKEVASTTLSISPLVANISTPSQFGLVRGNNVPITGEAYGTGFKQYILEYGGGLAPTSWQKIAESTSSQLLPPAPSQATINAGNLANWDTGVNEFKPWNSEGLNGVYTLRLRVIGTDGREASDSFPVIVGRLAHSAEGGTITSPDGKARLAIPPLAIEDTFILMALVPLSQSEPDGGWKQSLPKDKQLAGEVYEVLQPSEQFRKPAALELAYPAGSDPAKLGIMLGDGSANGWRYIGGSVDSQKQVIRVDLSGFGGDRALVGVFSAGNFGPAQPARPLPQPFAFKGSAPVVSASNGVAFYDDFDSQASEWQAEDRFGTQLSLVKGSEAGLTGNNTALKVTRLQDGVRLVQARSSAYDAAQYPILSFDYRVSEDSAPNLLVKTNEVWWQIETGTPANASTKYYQSIAAPAFERDDKWHHYQIDLYAALRAEMPDATSIKIDQIVLGRVVMTAYMQALPVDDGAPSSSYFVDNFAALTAISSDKLAFSWSPPAGTTYRAYSYALDQRNDTVPAEANPVAAASATAPLPNGAQDGLWYLHVKGQNGDGSWSDTAHFPIMLDRKPPLAGQPDPAADGAGSPEFIQLNLQDPGSGINPASIKLEINGQVYTVGRGLRYQPVLASLTIIPSQLRPTPAFVPNGQKLTLTLQAAEDYAGNKLAAPFTWSFTADRPKATGTAFRQLTNDGWSPALSPDGSKLAFISNRSGSEKIWIINSDDFAEQAKSAKVLNSGSGREAGPSWSPDGSMIAFVSDAGGSPQIWIAGADGSGARALTGGSGTAASPSWSPDGKALVFVRDGNIWQINTDGSDARRISDYTDSPIQAVRWQPSGQLLAVDFKLYQETIELYNPATRELTPVTSGGQEREPAWLNSSTLIYTAPASHGSLDAIWEVGLDGSNAIITPDSGQAGVSDMQASPSAIGNMLAAVSTRGGKRAIWLRSTLQIAQFDAAPSTGVPAGNPLNISYSLPADAGITLSVLDSSNKVVRVLEDKVHHAKGMQTLTWNGTGTDGKQLAAGNYRLKLSAQIAGGDPLERYATATLLDAANIGILHLEVNSWANQPASKNELQISVYPERQRTKPIALANYEQNPSFKLPAGRYDLAVRLGEVQREFTGITVEGSKTITQPVDLQLGGLDISILSAPGQPITGTASIRVMRSSDPSATPVRYGYSGTSSFVLPPGKYDVTAEFEGVRQAAYGLEVKQAQVTKQEINLGSGVYRLNVLASDGNPAEPSRVAVRAYAPDNHKDALVTVYGTPAELRLPAGRYDIKLEFSMAKGGIGSLEQFITGVEIRSGQTREETYNMHLGEAKIDVQEVAGKPADSNKTTIQIFRTGDSSNALVTVYANTVTFQAPAGKYDVVVTYDQAQIPAPALEIKEGQSIAKIVSAGSGTLKLNVLAYNGKPVEGNQIVVGIFSTQNHSTTVASALYTNPSDLRLPAGRYDVLLDYNGTANAGNATTQLKEWINNIEITAGQTLTLEHNLHLGEVDLSVVEAPGTPAENNRLTYSIYNTADRSTEVASVLFLNQAHLLLKPGTYVIVPSYTSTSLEKEGPVGTPFEVKEGQQTTHEVNLKLGHIQVQVVDAAGNPVDKSLLSARIYPAGKRDTYFTSDIANNPLDLVAHGGIAYDLEVELQTPSGYKKATITNQSVKEGETLKLTLHPGDFK